VPAEPCSGNEEHVPREYIPGEIQRLWQFYSTPDPMQGSCIHSVVVIDCEMGVSKYGDSELIRVTLIDFFSSAILIDKLVYPSIPMRHYNTRYSGVTQSDMADAVHTRTCFFGRDEARRAVWDYVAPWTVVVGHSVSNDLVALRWIHSRVVDTYLNELFHDKRERERMTGKSFT
jgi:RNA exonuclease 1